MTRSEQWRKWGSKWNDALLAILFVGLGVLSLVIRANDIEKLSDCAAEYRQAMAAQVAIVSDHTADADEFLVSLSSILAVQPLPANWQALIGQAIDRYSVQRLETSRKQADLEQVTC